jgi:hypothetical protein
MDVENPKTYLIKRSNSFRDLKKNNSKRKGYFEITIRKTKYFPPSINLKEKDIVYVAETSGGIYAKGIVIESCEVEEFSTVEEVLSFSKNFNDDSYWINKIREFSIKLSQNSNYKLRFHQYFVDQKLLRRTIPYYGLLNKYDASVNIGLSGIFFELSKEDIDYIHEPDFNLKQIRILKPEIPGDLRLKIYSYFNQNYSIGHLIDVDHFVPKSVGGPGNIIENLVPVGFSLNRYKSDSIPRSFFEVAINQSFKNHFLSFEKEIFNILKNDQKFIRKKEFPKSINLAKKMNEKISKWENMEEIKKFYFEVNKKFNPEYTALIYEVK